MNNATTESESKANAVTLPTLVGSDRQLTWASTLRADALAAGLDDDLLAEANVTADQVRGLWAKIADARFWINNFKGGVASYAVEITAIVAAAGERSKAVEALAAAGLDGAEFVSLWAPLVKAV